MSKKTLVFKGRLQQEQAIEYLEELVASIKAGKVCVENGDRHVVLNPTDQVYVEISASEKRDKEKISFEISWMKDVPAEEEAKLKISSEEPQPEEDTEKVGEFTGE